MGEHRSRIGAALLASVAVFLAAAATIATSNAAGWGSAVVIGLLVLALLCLAGSLGAFRPVPSGNAKMNRLIARQYRSLRRRRTIRRLLRLPQEQPQIITVGRRPVEQAGITAGRSITAGEDIEAAGAIRAGEAIKAGGSISAGGSQSRADGRPAQSLREHQQREHTIRTGEDIARLILQAELQYGSRALDTESHRAVYNLIARIESWVRGIDATEQMPRYSGDVAADLARLNVFVANELTRLHAEQQQD